MSMIFGVIAELPDVIRVALHKKRTMKKRTKGFIVKWRTGERWSVHVQHLNTNVSDSNRYETASGRNKKVIRLKELYPGYLVVTKKELAAILKAKK